MREQRSDNQGRDGLVGIISKVIETFIIQGYPAIKQTGYETNGLRDQRDIYSLCNA